MCGGPADLSVDVWIGWHAGLVSATCAHDCHARVVAAHTVGAHVDNLPASFFDKVPQVRRH